MKIICILPVIYTERSNGIIILCSIYSSLRRKAQSQAIYICRRDREQSSLARYKDMFGESLITYSEEDKEAVASKLSEEQFTLIRPDNLEGLDNDIHWLLAKAHQLHRIINILLAPPFAFASEISILNYYSVKDYFVIANQSIMPAFRGLEELDLFIESKVDTAILDHVENRETSTRTITSIYIGKGIIRALPRGTHAEELASEAATSGSNVLIKRSWPTSRNELYTILASSKALISFDPFSHIERVATLLGTPVLKVPRYNIREIPGVFTAAISAQNSAVHIPEHLEIKSESRRDYEQAVATGEQNLSKIVSIVLSAANQHFRDLSDKLLIPFSRECIYCFASQLRGLRPYLGATSMDRENEELSAKVAFELVNPFIKHRDLAQEARNYRLKADRLTREPCNKDIANPEAVYYSYLRYANRL